jgi:PKHD-type hydroxylase
MQKSNEKPEAIKLREKLGVGVDTLLNPTKPEMNIIDENIVDVLSHTGIFSPEDCELVIAQCTPDEWLAAEVNAEHNVDDGVVRGEWRHSRNHWVQPDPENMWLFDKMLALTLAANLRFCFEVDLFESIQLAKYEEGMHYYWHMDLGPGKLGNRKLSITVQLSDPDSYEGGDLVIDNGPRLVDAFRAPRDRGSVTVFPSFMKHRVTPVTKGVRHSLVVWASGTNRFR